MATVAFTPPGREQFDDLPRPMQMRMLDLFERLRAWPEVSGVKALRGNLAGHYRLRTGDYRLQFRVEGETVFLERMGHRDRFYED